MADQTQLRFNSHIGKLKPENIVNRKAACPFCDRTQLTDVLAEAGNILLVKNKYPVLEETCQTVLIETDDCDSELSLYSTEHVHRLFDFAFAKWMEMEDSGRYASVLFFKNHGPHSGGTIRHPHMQIVGLEHVDYTERVRSEHFDGVVIDQRPGLLFNVSTHPRVGFFEFNVVLDDLDKLHTFADFTQIAAHYTLNGFHHACNSYNLFFYHFEGRRMVKIVPRFATSPIYIGYSIPQVSNRIGEAALEIRRNYLRG